MEVYRAVMLTGSIKGASKLLFISQPAVSRIISHTESTLGFALFNRLKGKLVPTPEGEALFREVDDFFQHAVRVDEFARGLALNSSGTLSIAASPCLSRSVMPRVITRFIERYPRIRVDFRTTLLNGMAQEVLSKTVDVAVSVLPLEHPNLTVEPFMHGRMVCIAPRGHPLADQETVSLADLGRYAVVAHHPSIPFGQIVAGAFEAAGVAADTRIHIHQTDVAYALVRAGAGVAMVDQFTVEGMNADDLEVLELSDAPRLTPSVVRSSFDNRETHADKFVELLFDIHPPQAAEQGA